MMTLLVCMAPVAAMVVVDGVAQLLKLKSFKMGGIRFVKMGRVTVSLSVSRPRAIPRGME